MMSNQYAGILAAGLMVSLAGAASGQWVQFVNETASRLSAPSSIGTNDIDEKEFAFADIDQDGDIDLVSVRKQPFTTTGKRVNALYMNENGVLVDRTALYASASDVGGDQGFLTPTNDRDVVLADLNGDGWLDMATAVTLTDNQAKHLSHPRIYINLGNDGNGDWQGFQYQDARIPQMHPTAGPRFCSVDAGDVDNDGDLDLYFGDYDSGGAQILDYNNRLLINDGNGFFTDQTNSRLTAEMALSAFGAASHFRDMNGDGVLDVVKQTALNPPQHVAVTYNNVNNAGFFNAYQVVDSAAPYFVAVGDLNNDGRPDMAIADDGPDHFWINNGNNGSGQATFTSFNFQYDVGGDDGFAGDAYIKDLNNDGWNDVLITDVDIDITGCNRRMHIFRNLGNAPNVTLREQQSGGQIASIPANELVGMHDVAIFDLNGDGYQDMVFGRCVGIRVWMQVPPTGMSFSYPNGIPGTLVPDQPTNIAVNITPIGGGSVNPATAKMTYSIGGGADVEVAMSHMGGNSYQVTLPAVPCPQTASFGFAANLNAGGTFTDPPSNGRYTALSADSIDTVNQPFDIAPAPAWTVSNDASLTGGGWERAIPVGTINAGVQAAPNDDASASSDFAYVTQNGAVGGAASASDVDGGPTRLTSPAIDLSGTDATISYSRWFYCNQQGVAGADTLLTEVSNNNGASWTTVHSTGGTNQGVGTPTSWETVSFVVSDFVTPTDQVLVRFTTNDNPNGSVTEAGIDNFSVAKVVCPTGSCPGDITGPGGTPDGVINVDDLNAILSAWNSNVGIGSPLDVANNDGIVNVDDLNVVLSAWNTNC